MRDQSVTRRSSLSLIGSIFALALPSGPLHALQTERASCAATPASLTPAGYHRVLPSTGAPANADLRVVAEIPLPGPATRFDYQSFDPTSHRLYINHMDAGETLVFSADSGRVIGRIGGVARATGVLAIPSLHRVYVSAAGAHEVVGVDDRTLQVAQRIGGIDFPDGIAYVSSAGKLFVSDESGSADVVIDVNTGRKLSTIALGGEAGNTHYDSVSHCILVAVQTRNQLVAIDPVSEKIVGRYAISGSDHPHGFAIDQPGRLLFMSSEGNATLVVLDLTTMRVIGTHDVGDSPDVLAWDPGWRRLYVASEGGLLSAFWADGTTLRVAGEYRAPHAHTVGLDPRTHRLYLPLQDIGGRPVLRVLAPPNYLSHPVMAIHTASAMVAGAAVPAITHMATNTSVDYQLFQTINGLAGSNRVLDVVMIACAKYSPFVYALVLAGLWLTWTDRNQRGAFLAGLSALVALGIGQVVGALFPRERPYLVHHT
jgi:DNA-binding beta-propeller fold protein YncE